MNTVATYSMMKLLSTPLWLLFVLILSTSYWISISSAQQDVDPCGSASTTTTNVDVVIVGAGISGLSAFVELKRIDPNVTVVIVEATDRIAGRVKKASIGDRTVELGANWLHNKGSFWFKLARKMNLTTVPTTYLNMAMYNVDGKAIQRRFESRFERFISEGKPFYNMLLAANDTREGLADAVYDGSESVKSVLTDFGYKEQSELDKYILWWNIDYEYGFSNVALSNFIGIDYNIPGWYDSETFVNDPRGMESMIQQYVDDNNIPKESIHLNTRVTDIVYDSSISNNEFNDTSSYKALIQTIKTPTNCTTSTATKYFAKRVVVTVPAAILRGAGYSINFQPSLDVTNFPYYGNQFNKVFFQFQTNFWGNQNEFIAILRKPNNRYLCNHWQNADVHIPGSKVLMCLLTSAGMKKYVARKLTTNDLLDPLRVVYGTDVVNENYRNVLMARWDLDPASGYAGYASFHSGYTIDQMYQFYGGYDSDGTFVQGQGYTVDKKEWIVHLSGAASCLEYNEQIEGAYYSGIRSARNVLQSLNSTKYETIEPLYECEP